MAIIENPGPTLTESQLAELEEELGCELPQSYRSFLLTSNGGVPTPETIDVAEFPSSPTDVQVLFGIGRSVESSRINWNRDTLAGRLTPDLLPIASDSGGNVFCLSLRETDRGAVLYCDLEAVFGVLEAEPSFYFVASSFEEFVAKFRTLE
jgi:cell wall assembly regulator SMI1